MKQTKDISWDSCLRIKVWQIIHTLNNWMVRIVEPFIICGNINVEKTSDTKKSRLGTFLWKLHPTNLIELPHQHVKINIKSNKTENSIIHFFLIRAVKILTTIKNFFRHAFLYGTRMKLLVIFFACFHKTENTMLIFSYMHFLKKIDIA